MKELTFNNWNEIPALKKDRVISYRKLGKTPYVGLKLFFDDGTCTVIRSFAKGKALSLKREREIQRRIEENLFLRNFSFKKRVQLALGI